MEGKISNIGKILARLKTLGFKSEISEDELKRAVIEVTGTISHVSVANYIKTMCLLNKIARGESGVYKIDNKG